MGSFNATCIVSNLPIEAGAPVRFLALARNAFEPDGNGYVCYVTGRWQLHGVPIKAKYNDYGSVENIEEGFTSRIFFEALALGAVEVGIGDNSCHDVAVRSDMDQKGWLEALWEGRVKVEDQRYRNRKIKEAKALDQQIEELTGTDPKLAAIYEDMPEPKTGIPSFRRIEKVLTEAGFELSTGGFGEGFLVDDVGSGFVRVRAGSYSEKKIELETLLPAIHGAGYAAMITAGSGSYSNIAEILVAPLPSTDPNVFIRVDHNPENYYAPRPVSQAMIREDVWQILLHTPIDIWSGSHTFESLRDASLKALEEDLAFEAELAALDAAGDHKAVFSRVLRRGGGLDSKPRENAFRDCLRGSEGVSGFSFHEAFRLGIESATSPDELRAYVVNLSETVYVQWVYSILHGQWHPTTNSSQEGNWKEHRAFMTKLLEIKGAWEEEEEDEDSDGESVDEEE